MKKLLLIAVILALGSSALAHVGVEHYVPRVPDPASMQIDGKEDDWDWFDSRLTMTMAGMEARPATAIDPQDYAVTYMTAWSPPPDNRFYFFARIRDNRLDLPDDDPREWWSGDYLQITFDADHSGGSILGTTKEQLANGQRYSMRVLPPTDQPELLYHTIHATEQLSVFVKYHEDRFRWSSSRFEGETSGWTDAAWTLEPADAGHGSDDVTYTFEFSCALWETYGLSPEESVRHLLESGQVIHVGPRPGDADGTPEKYLLYQRGGTIYQDRDADQMVDYVLVEDFSSLGTIAGLVTNPEDGSPWGGIDVAVDDAEGRSRARSRTAEDGRYHLPLLPGTYSVTVLHAEEEGVAVEVAAGARVDSIDFSPTLTVSALPTWPFIACTVGLGVALLLCLIPLIRRAEILGILLRSPGQALQQIADRPDWIGPACLILVSLLLVSLVLFGKLFTEMGSGAAPVPQGMRLMMMIFMPVTMLIGMLVAGGVAWVVHTVVIYLLARMSGERAGFYPLLSTVGYALLPETVLAQIVLAVMLSFGFVEFSVPNMASFSMPTSLTTLVPGLADSGDWLRHLFDRIELFALWSVVLTAVGLQRVCAMSMRKAAILITIYWLLETATVVGIFALAAMAKGLMTGG